MEYGNIQLLHNLCLQETEDDGPSGTPSAEMAGDLTDETRSVDVEVSPGKNARRDRSPTAAALSSRSTNRENIAANPSKKAARSAASDTTAALRTASDVMVAVSQRLAEKKAQADQPNPTRAFCDLMYQQLMSIPNNVEREQLQYDIHGLILHHKRSAASMQHPVQSSAMVQSVRAPEDESVSNALHSAFSMLHEW